MPLRMRLLLWLRFLHEPLDEPVSFERGSLQKEIMKIRSSVGVLLIVLGVIALAYGGISYTSREKIVDLGPIEATAKRARPSRCPPYSAAWQLLAASYCLLELDAEQRSYPGPLSKVS